VTSRRVDTGQLSGSGARQYVHIMLVNFSHEEITIPKATALGVAEEISPNLVATVNDEKSTKYKTREGRHSQVNTVKGMAKMRSYTQKALIHLSGNEKQVMETVLLKYGHVFYNESDRKFPGTGVI
jgi:hypothetical protein